MLGTAEMLGEPHHPLRAIRHISPHHNRLKYAPSHDDTTA